MHLSASQSAYRRGRSTSDIVKTHKWLSALNQKKESFKILGVDLNSAFDTIDRGKLLEILKNIIKPNNLRIIYTLLNGTGINVRFGSITTRVNTEIGSPQGDGLSLILFVVYMEAALR